MSKKTNPYGEPSVTCGFYNSLNGDRMYDTLQISSIFDGIIGDGIFQSIGDRFVVQAGSGNTVNVGTGKAWYNHTWTINDAVLPIDCGEAEFVSNYHRIDSIVIEVDTTEAVRDNFIKVIHGVPSEYPVKPELNTKSGVYQHALAHIYRAGSSTEIVQENITNAVGTEETPFVTAILEVRSVDDLCLQWQASLDTFKQNEKDDIAAFMDEQEGDFNEWFSQMKTLMGEVITETTTWSDNQKNAILAWFDGMKDQLSIDAAINLQLQIDNEEAKRLLLVGFVDGEKVFSDDGTTITSTDPYGRKIVKTFTNNFLTSTTELFSAEGGLIARLVKNFSEDGSTINTETTIEDLSLINGDEIAY